MNNITDILIVGAGPAGLSAAVNAVVRGKTVRIFSNKENYLSKAERVDNHLGFYNISGKELMNKFSAHAKSMDIKIEDGKVVNILPFGDFFMVNVSGNIINAKNIILAMGVSNVKEITGEKELIGKGVSYCATCDGMLYRGKTAVVWDKSKDACNEANYLDSIGVNVIFISNNSTTSTSNLNKTINFIEGSIKTILGDNNVESIILDNGNKIKTDAIFILREAIAPSSLIEGLKIENGFITVNRNMETNIKGIYATGDITGKPLQLSKAVSEGLIAAQHVAKNK